MLGGTISLQVIANESSQEKRNKRITTIALCEAAATGSLETTPSR